MVPLGESLTGEGPDGASTERRSRSPLAPSAYRSDGIPPSLARSVARHVKTRNAEGGDRLDAAPRQDCRAPRSRRGGWARSGGLWGCSALLWGHFWGTDRPVATVRDGNNRARCPGTSGIPAVSGDRRQPLSSARTAGSPTALHHAFPKADSAAIIQSFPAAQRATPAGRPYNRIDAGIQGAPITGASREKWCIVCT